jgi:hypothetical protein
MVLLPGDRHAELPQPDDTGDDADGLPGRVEDRTLFDMRLQERAEPVVIHETVARSATACRAVVEPRAIRRDKVSASPA